MVKFMYLRDPSFRKNRTLTIARRKVDDNTIEFAYSINLIERAFDAYRCDGYVPEEIVYDEFSRAKGRQMAQGRLETPEREKDLPTGKNPFRFRITKGEDERFDMAILKFLEEQAPHAFARKIAKYHRQQKALMYYNQAPDGLAAAG